jgi:transcription antitermination factor NusG
MNWYAVSTWAQNALDARADLIALGYQIYVPCETVERRVGRRMVAKRRPVWPGYLFVRCYEAEFGAVLAVEGVHDFIRDYDKREPVKLVENALVPVLLAELFGELDYTRKPETWTPAIGDRVKVRSGKWKGYLGSVLSLSKRKAILDTKWCRMEIDPGDLEAAA